MTRDEIINFVIDLEGGYSNNPADPGGATNRGITARYLAVARAKDPTLPTDVRDLTLAQTAALYVKNEWAVIHGDLMPSQLALCMFDTAVNQGPGVAVRILQALHSLPNDGIMGPDTLKAAQQTDVLDYNARRAVRYAMLDGRMDGFEFGWMRRLLRVYTAAIS